MHDDASLHTAPPAAKPTDLPTAIDPERPWWRLLTSYHWFVLAVAALGWLFDCMDQQLFLMARVPAMHRAHARRRRRRRIFTPAW